jgi:hypothetical protein
MRAHRVVAGIMRFFEAPYREGLWSSLELPVVIVCGSNEWSTVSYTGFSASGRP